MFGSILLSILGISLLICIHEAGHFLAARAAGVRVEVFSLGFGSRLWGFVWRGTDFRISAVPFGGYVMVAGADAQDRRYPARESLWAKCASQRALFWSGGVLMNLLFALIVFPLVFHAGVPFPAPVVGEVLSGGAAWEAGIETGDRIRAVGGREVRSFDNLHMLVALGGNRPAQLLVQGADGDERTISVTPHWNREDGLYDLGIGPPWQQKPLRLTVDADGPAAHAGVQTGDLLQAVNGVSTVGKTMRAALGELDRATDHPVTLLLRRNDREFPVELKAELLPDPAPPQLGIRPLPRVVVGLRQGDAMLTRLGLQRGDVLLAVDDKPFLSGDLAVAANGPGQLTMIVLRGEQRLTLQSPVSDAERQSLPNLIALGADESLMLWVKPDGAAAAAGLRNGDRMLTINGEAVHTFKALAKAVHAAGEVPMQLHLQRLTDDADPAALAKSAGDLDLPTTVDLSVQPRQAPVYSFGFVPSRDELTEVVRGESVPASIRLGVACSFDMVKQIYVTLKRLATGEVGSNNLGGIIRMGTVSYQAAQRGMAWFWYFLAMLSVNLAIVNLLPIPVLDGGHLLFVLIEKVKGSPVSARVHGYSQVVGLVFVLMLVLFVTYNDILWLL